MVMLGTVGPKNLYLEIEGYKVEYKASGKKQRKNDCEGNHANTGNLCRIIFVAHLSPQLIMLSLIQARFWGLVEFSLLPLASSSSSASFTRASAICDVASARVFPLT